MAPEQLPGTDTKQEGLLVVLHADLPVDKVKESELIRRCDLARDRLALLFQSRSKKIGRHSIPSRRVPSIVLHDDFDKELAQKLETVHTDVIVTTVDLSQPAQDLLDEEDETKAIQTELVA